MYRREDERDRSFFIVYPAVWGVLAAVACGIWMLGCFVVKGIQEGARWVRKANDKRRYGR